MKQKIDFIGIGAQKAGTTWLHARLMELSEFSLPCVKELHYFDKSEKYSSSNKLTLSTLSERLRSFYWVKLVINANQESKYINAKKEDI